MGKIGVGRILGNQEQNFYIRTKKLSLDIVLNGINGNKKHLYCVIRQTLQL